MAMFARARGDCPAGTSYYVCSSNNFRGCCALDPCDKPGCPDGLVTETETTKSTSLTSTIVTITDSNVISTTTSSSSTETSSSIVTTTQGNVISTKTSSSSTLSVSRGGQVSRSVSPAEPSNTWSAQTDKAASTRSMPTGAIVGIAVGTLVGASLVAIMVVALMRRRGRCQSRSPRFGYKPPKLQSWFGDGVAPEKQQQGQQQQYRQCQDARSPDSLASGADPFAPFGGRIDRNAYRASSAHFEMDASPSASPSFPAELPNEPAAAAEPFRGHYESMAQYAPATDPNAVLSSPRTTGEAVAHLGYWNQWRSLENNQDG